MYVDSLMLEPLRIKTRLCEEGAQTLRVRSLCAVFVAWKVLLTSIRYGHPMEAKGFYVRANIVQRGQWSCAPIASLRQGIL